MKKKITDFCKTVKAEVSKFEKVASPGYIFKVPSSGGQIDPNIDNIDTNVGIDTDRYQCNEIDTLVSVSLMAVCVCVSATHSCSAL